MKKAAPLSAQEVGNLLRPFTLKDTIAVAVSGGADSLALTLLLKQWAEQQEQPLKIVALTVDHQLRPESTNEAQTVHRWLTERSIHHEILTWHHKPISSGLQQKSRQARYHLLSSWCHAHEITTLMTAHHLHDQWETVLMRLSKGTGLTGLCGIRSVVKTGFGQLIRPLLTVDPSRLQETLIQFQQPFLQDPSNDNNAYARVRWRRLLPILAAEGLSPQMMHKTLLQLQGVEFFCQEQTEHAFNRCLGPDNCLNLHHLQALPLEIACRVLKKIIRQIGQAPYELNSIKLNRLYQTLLEANFKGATAGGCYLKKIAYGLVKIYPEKRPSHRERDLDWLN